MRFLLLLCLTGIAIGLQPGLKYNYRYLGLANTGIPEYSTVGSSTGISAEIEIEPYENGHAYIQFKHVRFGIYQGCLGCDMRNTRVNDFSPLEDSNLQHLIEQPIMANLYDLSDDISYTSEHEDILWLRNVRRGIVGSLRNILTQTNFENTHCALTEQVRKLGLFSKTFSRKEQTIHGICAVDYSVHPLFDFGYEKMNAIFESRMETDVQRPKAAALKKSSKTAKGRKSSKKGRPSKLIAKGPHIDDKLFHVTRSIDFDNCDENVYIGLSTGGIRFDGGVSQREWLGGRHAGGEYIFRGGVGGFRLEEARLEGGFAGIAGENTNTYMHARTNQTFVLESVELATNVHNTAQIEQCKVHGWMQEMVSPFPKPKYSRKFPWITYTNNISRHTPLDTLLGIQISDEEIAESKQFILRNVKQAARILTGDYDRDIEVQNGLALNLLKKLPLVVYNIPQQDLQELVDMVVIENRFRPHDMMEQKLLLDTLVNSGSRKGLQIIIKLMKEERLTDVQKFFISASMPNALADITVLPDLVRVATEIDLSKNPVVGSTFLFNLATIIKHYCSDPHANTRNYAAPLFGDNNCDTSVIQSEFFPYLRNIIFDESKTWERIVAIYVVERCGPSPSIDMLGPIALGEKGDNEHLRARAIFALMRWSLTYETRESAMQVLNDIFTNPMEMPKMRVAALLTAISWKPKPSFFYRLARLTWTEPSTAVASLYRSIITTMSETQHPYFKVQNQAAAQALRFIRPMSPSSQYPYMFSTFEGNYATHVGKSLYNDFHYMPYPEPMKNFEHYLFSQTELNGFSFTNFETLFTSGMVGEFIQKEFEKTSASGLDARIIEDAVGRIQDVIRAFPVPERTSQLLTFQGRFLENIGMLVPILQKTGERSYDLAYLTSLLAELQVGLNRVFGKFFVAATHKGFLPNDMGMVISNQHDWYGVVVSSIHARLSISSINELNKKSHLFVESYFRDHSQVNSDMYVMVPWYGAALQTSLVANREIALPTLITFDYDAITNKQQPKFEVAFEPGFDKEFNVLKADNVPSVHILPITFKPLYSSKVTKQSRPLFKHEDIQKSVKLPDRHTGLDLTINWKGQTRYPFDLLGIKNIVQSLHDKSHVATTYLYSSPIVDYWSAELRFNPRTSETKNITIGYTCQTPKENDEYTGQISQTTGQTTEDVHFNDYDDDDEGDFGQEYQEQFGDIDHEFGQNEVDSDFEIDDSFQQKSEKLVDTYRSGDKVKTVSFSVSYLGERDRKYELVYSWANPSYANNRKKTKTHLVFLASGIPDQKVKSICFDRTMIAPVLLTMDTLPEILQHNLTTEIVRHLRPNCGKEAAVTTHTTLNLSPQKIQKLKDEISLDCQYDAHDPLHAFMRLAIYDDIHSHISFHDSLKTFYANIKHAFPIPETVNDLIVNYYNSDEKEVDITLKRCLATDSWYFSLNRGDHHWNLDALPSNKFIDFAFAVNTYRSGLNQNRLQTPHIPSTNCVVKDDTVRTYDGVVYHYEPTECWTVATQDCTNGNWIVLIRKATTESTIPEVKIIDRENGKVIGNDLIEMSDIGKKTHFYSSNGKEIGEIYRKKLSTCVKLPKKVMVTISDRVTIKALDNYGRVCGVCGRKNYEKFAQFLGPRHCVYSDPQEFFNAWTGPSDTCGLAEVLRKRANVEEYQKSCKFIWNVFTEGIHYHEYDMKHVYILKHIGDYNCVSLKALPQCAKNTEEERGLVDKVVNAYFSCYKPNNTPEVIQQAINNGKNHITVYVHYQPNALLSSKVHVNTVCVPK